MSRATGRSLLELPLEIGSTFLDHWDRHAAALGEWLGIGLVPVRVLLGDAPEVSGSLRFGARVGVSFERDPKPCRGTGGVLRDIASEYAPDDILLVANAAQVLLEPLPRLTAVMSATGGEIVAVSHVDGTPSGILLLECRCLEALPEVGFVDLKEQGLELISRRHRGTVVYRRLPTGLPVRGTGEYISAIRSYQRSRVGVAVGAGPFEEDGLSSFSIVEDGAEVEPGATVHDSVVLSGARIRRNAFVVRSVVCPGAVVRRSRTDQLVT